MHHLCRYPRGDAYYVLSIGEVLAHSTVAIMQRHMHRARLGYVSCTPDVCMYVCRAYECHSVSIVHCVHAGGGRVALACMAADARDPDALVDAADPSQSNWLRYLNHATPPAANCQMTDGAVVTTLRAIKAGEELLFDYGRAYWKKAYFFEHTQPSTAVAGITALPVTADGVSPEVQSAAESAHDDAVARALSGLAAGILRQRQIDSVLARLRAEPFVSQCYRYAAGNGDEGKAWYLLDEFGSRIRHHAEAHCGDDCATVTPQPEPQPREDTSSASRSGTCLARMAVYLDPEHGAFSVLWMESDGHAGDEVLLLDAK